MNWQRFFESAGDFSRLTPTQTALITAGTFLAVSLVLFLVAKLVFGIGRNRLPEAEAIGSRRPLALGVLTDAFAYVFPVSQHTRDKLRRELQQAGYYHRRALDEFLGVRNAALISWMIFVGAAMVALANPDEDLTPKVLVGGAVVLLFIYGLPRVVLGSQATSRCQRIQHALPDALDMITMTVSGGLPLRDAIDRVSGELRAIHPDIACELAMVDLQANTGSLDIALRHFANRLDIPDVTALASMVQHAERLGGQVSTAFREFADSIRRSRRQQAEERGNKASVKLLFPIVFFLAPPIYILLLGPAFVELKNFVQQQNQPGGVLTQRPTNALPDARRNATSSAASGASPGAPDTTGSPTAAGTSAAPGGSGAAP